MIERKSLLLVEGKSEMCLIGELCSLYDIDINFKTVNNNSITNLKISLKTHLKSTNEYNKIWVIIDADTNFESAWQSIRDILMRSGKYSIIKHNTPIPRKGIIVYPDDANDITIGVWIMPNNKDNGMLEDFLISLIKCNDTLYGKAANIVDEIEAERSSHPNVYKSVHKSKAVIHTWLAWQDAPGESLGTAVKKKMFSTDKNLCKKFTEWLNALN
ncbi:MAG: DUF3226 domain-containing protein [Rikenellaceae bacterium]